MIERYEDPQVTMIWNRQAEIERWFLVEVAWMEAVASKEASELLKKIGPPDLARVAELEQTTKHEVVAFLRALDEKTRESSDFWLNTTGESGHLTGYRELRQWLHYGLTSSDVVDTGLGLALKDTHELILSPIADMLVSTLNHMSRHWDDSTLAMGRTHGQHATQMPAGHRWVVLYGMLVDARHAFGRARQDIALGKLSGPLGSRRNGTDSVVLGSLGLDTVPSTQIVPRDGIARWANCLAALATGCEAIATQVWLLSQQEIGEVIERQTPTQVGSSAMPHKCNPIRSENIRGLARLVRMYAGVLQTNVVQWGEHDLAHSSVERVALPDLCHVSATLFHRTTTLLNLIEFRFKEPPTEFRDTHWELMRLQRDGVPYVEAHARLMSPSYLDGKISDNNPAEEA